MTQLRLTMKRKVVLRFVGFFSVVCVAWFLNIGVRSTQFVVQELNPEWRMEQADPVEGCGRSGISDLSAFRWNVRHGRASHFHEAFSSDVDLDGDGLNALQEILRLTADDSLDSDNDGIPDPEDQCIGCRISSYRDRLETMLVSTVVCEFDSGKDRIYVVSTHSVDPSSTCPDTTYVPSPSWAADFLIQQPETWGPERNPDWGLLEIEPRLYVPGLIYGYYVDYFCGPLCAETSYAFILDIPIIGPVYLGRHVLWVS